VISIPVVVDEVTTLCGPGELIDVIVTETWHCYQSKPKGLHLKNYRQSGLPIKTLKELTRLKLSEICGKPEKPQLRRQELLQPLNG
jgi:citrate lyase subunit alpha/citrate CoA-transferase